jgi:hypothetical protein
MGMSKRRYAWLLCAAAIVVLMGCSLSRVGLTAARVGDLQRESVTVERQDAESVRVQIRMGAGDLAIAGGAEALMEADFAYNVQEWEPAVTYDVTNGQGRLTIRQPSTQQVSVGRGTRYEWDLRFDETTPLDMRIETGAGRQRIDLAGLTITRLDVKLGAGDAEIDVTQNPELGRLEFDVGVGSVEIDMRGPWDENVDVTVQGGVGSTTLRLPTGVGVRVDLTRGLGSVDTRGLTRQDGAWVNSAYGTSDVTMNLRIRTGVGSITLDARE